MNLPKSLELIPKYYAQSSWWEHVPIAHWIVEKLKPASIVELGTHYGVSFFSFCFMSDFCFSSHFKFLKSQKNEIFTQNYKNIPNSVV